MGGIYITYDTTDPVYYVPQSSKEYFASFRETFVDILRGDVLPTAMVILKFGILQRVIHWSKMLLEFYKLHQYLGHLRETIAKKKLKAEKRARINDGTKVCRACQESFGIVDEYVFHQVNYAVVERAREQFLSGIMLPGGMEQSVITSFAMAAQRINAYQLQISNYEMAGVEFRVLCSLSETVEVLNRYNRAHLIIAFLTNTIYIICILKL